MTAAAFDLHLKGMYTYIYMITTVFDQNRIHTLVCKDKKRWKLQSEWALNMASLISNRFHSDISFH